jgi:hypothetical protein
LREEEETALEDIYNNVKNDTANVKDEGVVNYNSSTNLVRGGGQTTLSPWAKYSTKWRT